MYKLNVGLLVVGFEHVCDFDGVQGRDADFGVDLLREEGEDEERDEGGERKVR
jgi:hypothetical protein